VVELHVRVFEEDHDHIEDVYIVALEVRKCGGGGGKVC
jgi:hypothetical protein